jgi:arylsulfatase
MVKNELDEFRKKGIGVDIKELLEKIYSRFDIKEETGYNFKTLYQMVQIVSANANLSKDYHGVTAYGLYADCMKELDDIVGELTGLLEELGVADNTIIMFSTDNGAATNSWPDGGNQPFHGEKGAGGWEGAFRVPVMVQWPGHIPAGYTTGEFMTMEDWMPTLLSMVGGGDIKTELLTGKKAGKMKYKVHLDGYDQSDLVLNKGKTKREDFYYFTESKFHSVRYNDWKVLFVDQEKWFRAPQTSLSTPFIINLKQDPFERMIHARGYDEWAENRSWVFGPAGKMVAEFVQSFKDFPPSQESMSLEVGNLSEMMKPAAN